MQRIVFFHFTLEKVLVMEEIPLFSNIYLTLHFSEGISTKKWIYETHLFIHSEQTMTFQTPVQKGCFLIQLSQLNHDTSCMDLSQQLKDLHLDHLHIAMKRLRKGGGRTDVIRLLL